MRREPSPLRLTRHVQRSPHAVTGPGSSRENYRQALRLAIDALRDAEKSSDAGQLWDLTMGVLERLYRWQEFERSRDRAGYDAAYRQTADGRSMGGLIWVRGRATHHQAHITPTSWSALTPMMQTCTT